ncbi:MAG TPA: type II toxin-antitoxin system VapC family toxin [Gammaproteobacteria bacterium]|nr:type II toxin-antitoxin system VapC family toxin [Gammaproteobacteria bacterium]
MPKRYLLDTNILSELIRRPARLEAKIAAAGDANICTSIVNACELRFGAEKKGSALLSGRVERLLDSLEVMPLDSGVDRTYARIRSHLESKGQPIGGNYYLIAAHAIERNCVLVTQNEKEFRRVPDLSAESWLARSRRP